MKDVSGTRVLVSALAADRIQLGSILGLDSAGRVGFTAFDTSNNTTSLFAGPDLANDRVIGAGDTLFGETLFGVSPRSISAPDGTFGDKRLFVFLYELNDGKRTVGVAIASKQVTRWTNSTGGSWSTAGNWAPTTVPTTTTATLFDLENSYDVTVGTRTSGRSAIENGSVLFRSPDLTLTGPLTVGGDAIFTQAEGKITVGELTVGSLPPVNPALPPLARFNLSNQNTEFTATGPTLIGNAGEGELFISDATMTSSEVRIGAGSKGTVSVGLVNTVWKTDALAVGFSHEATLNIERGARVESTTVVIGLGTELKQELAVVNVDNEGRSSPNPETGNWFIRNTLTVGDKLPGRLTVSKNGVVGVGDPARTGLAAHGSVADALIEVDGAGSTTANRSSIFFLTDLEVASGPNSFVDLSVVGGGFVHVGAALILGEAPGSTGEILVSGVNANGLRSELEQGSTSVEPLSVGKRGDGVLVIGSGGLVNCRAIQIGGLAGGRGDVHVDGRERDRDATLVANDGVFVGGNPVLGTVLGSPGTLTVVNGGRVEADGGLFVSRNGRVRGNGTIVTVATLNMDGTVEPGIGFEPPLAELSPIAAPFRTSTPLSGRSVAQIEQGAAGARRSTGVRAMATTIPTILPDTLTIQGNVVLGAGGVIELDVGGTSAGTSDKLIVQGTLILGGTVSFNFTNGFAPQQGEVLDLITATAVNGAFATTTISGLAPGFQFTLTPNAGGGVRLTALNDGVSTTIPSIPAPTITSQPASAAGVLGGSVRFEVASSTIGATYQWRKNGVALTGATNASFTLTGLIPADAGDYDAIVSAAGRSSISATATLTMPVGPSSRIANFSARTPLASGQILIVGFVLQGGPKPMLVRAAGPALNGLLTGAHPDPRISLLNRTGALIESNDNWLNSLAPAMQSLGAFAFLNGSTDAALLHVAEGLHSVHVSGAGAGIVLVEAYDALAGTSSRLINFSARSFVGNGASVLIAGFVLDGSGTKTLLLRGIGPTLASLGVTGVLGDPRLGVFNASGAQVAQNDNWSEALTSTFVTIGAFGLPSGSKDAALLVTLPVGAYSVHISGVGNATGEGLVEIYEVP